MYFYSLGLISCVFIMLEHSSAIRSKKKVPNTCHISKFNTNHQVISYTIFDSRYVSILKHVYQVGYCLLQLWFTRIGDRLIIKLYIELRCCFITHVFNVPSVWIGISYMPWYFHIVLKQQVGKGLCLHLRESMCAHYT